MIEQFLNSFNNFEKHLDKTTLADYSLTNLTEILDRLGNPQQRLKVIHIAGTKGKGSTAAFIASILHQAGLTVGLYTSPHLHRLNERIRILHPGNLKSYDPFSGSIADEELMMQIHHIREHIAHLLNEDKRLTYFEVLTVLAIMHFAKQEVDWVVLETGLGGRLDATNIVPSQIAVITPISLDHQHILGDTIAKIAREKAGIIKTTSQQVVIAPQEKEALEVIIGRCREFGIKPVLVNPTIIDDKKIALRGVHQQTNAACALAVVNILKDHRVVISDAAITRGLDHIRFAGRFDVIAQKPTIIVDCAHNVASMRALAQTLLEEYPYHKPQIVLGVSSDKDIKGICQQIKDSGEHFYLTKADHPRAHVFTMSEARQYFSEKKFSIIPDLNDAIKTACQHAGNEGIVCITGSVFVVGQSMRHIIQSRHQHVSS